MTVMLIESTGPILFEISFTIIYGFYSNENDLKIVHVPPLF